MKKYFLGAFVALVVAGAAIANVSINSQRNANLSAISVANIEALSGENSSSTTCYTTGGDYCGTYSIPGSLVGINFYYR
jgi:hypothetical protein